MHIIAQLGIFLAVSVAGDALSRVLPFAMPGSVLGMLLMLALLGFGLVKEWHIAGVANFFLNNMAVLFVPLAVGVIEVYPLIRHQMVGLAVLCIVTTLLTFAATVGTALLVMRWQKRRGESVE